MSKFSFSGLFGSKDNSSNSSNHCYSQQASDNIISIKFKNGSFDKHWYHASDVYDERGCLLEESNSLVDPTKGKEYVIYQWVKNEGDYVEQGDVLFLIRYAPYTNPHGYLRVSILPPFKSTATGILRIRKSEDSEVFDGDVICEIEKTEKPTNFYLPNESVYHFYFNKYLIPRNIREPQNLKNQFGGLLWNYETDKIHILEWLVNDLALVEEGEPLVKVGAIYEGQVLYKFTLKSKVSGYVYRILPNQYGEPLYQDSLLCLIFKTPNDLYRYIHFNIPNINYDDFSQRKSITWDVVGGYVLPFDSTDSMFNIGAVIADSSNGEGKLMFSLENHNSQDFIVFKFFRDEYNLRKGDEIQFMYEDNTIDKFLVDDEPSKVNSPWNKLHETKVPLTQSELKNLKEKKFIKWKIESANGSKVITGINTNERFSGNLFSRIVNDFAKEFIELVTQEIQDYKPLFDREIDSSVVVTEECHVYLMHDTTNNFYKIGISNKPEYREKTLLGDKPTIKLICSKEFPNRGIAKSIEQALHSNYDSKRIRGEWFELAEKEVNDIMSTLK